MNLVFVLAVFFVCWWIILFAILPFGVTTQAEAGEVNPGTEGSAPVAPRLLVKMAVTSLVAALVTALIVWLVEGGVISLQKIPYLPEFERMDTSSG